MERKKDCVFCKLIAHEGPVSLVYEDDLVVVFPVLHPVNEGHVIVVSKAHAESLEDLDSATAAHAMNVAMRMAHAIRQSRFKCEGINLFVADGSAAGQEVPHFHLHVYPRFTGDGFGFQYDKSKHFVPIDRQRMDAVADEIRRHLGS